MAGPACTCNFNDIVSFNSNAGLPTSFVAGSAVAYNAATGRASANTNAGVSNASGNMTVTFAGPFTSATVTHIAAAINSSNDPAFQLVLVDDLTFQRARGLPFARHRLEASEPSPMTSPTARPETSRHL